MTSPTVLVIAVAYQSSGEAAAFVEQHRSHLDSGVVVAIADNSPEPSAELASHAAATDNLHYFHYPANPGYSGAARQVVVDLVAESGHPLTVDAVVLSNVDVTYAVAELRDAIAEARAHSGDRAWLLAPDIVEAGRRYRANPHVVERPKGPRRAAIAGRSYPTYVAYRQLYRRRRALTTNPHAGRPPFTTMHAAHGAFIVFGADFFRRGGVFHNAPLFGEETGFSEQARVLGVPIFYMPTLTVRHETEVSTSPDRVGWRQRYRWYQESARFYSNWDPRAVLGSMVSLFVADPD